MTILEWATLGALFLGIMIFCARIMRKGLTTLDDHRQQRLASMQAVERKIAEDRKNISAFEQLTLVKAALEDLVRLEDQPARYEIISGDHYIDLCAPAGDCRIELLMREKTLSSTTRTLHGRPCWILSIGGQKERHPDPASLMRSLNRHLHDPEERQEEPAHLAKRLAGNQDVARKFHLSRS